MSCVWWEQFTYEKPTGNQREISYFLFFMLSACLFLILGECKSVFVVDNVWWM